MRQTHEGWAGAPTPDLCALALGQLGVFLFFIISGFIMQHTAGGTGGQAGAAWNFFERRIARIVPLYWMFTALAVAFPGAVYLGAQKSGMGIISSFAFLPDMWAASRLPVLPVGWTLNFEMSFYVVFAICLGLPRRTGIALLFVGLFGFFLLLKGQPVFPSVRDLAQWWGSPLWFAVGVLFAIVRENFGSKGGNAVAGFALAVLLYLAVVLRTMFVFDATGTRLLIIAPMLVVALCTLMGDLPESAVMRPLVWLGDRSYTLYLGHLLVLGISSALWLRLFTANWPLAYDVVTFCLCLLFCAPVYRLELRLTKLARTFLVSRVEAAQATVPGL